MSKTHSKTFKCLFFLMLTHFSVQTLLKQRTSELDEAFWVGVSTGLPCYASVHLSKTQSSSVTLREFLLNFVWSSQIITPQNTILRVAVFLVPINTLMCLSALNLLGLNNSILFRIPWIAQWLICLIFFCDPVELVFSSLHNSSDFPFTLLCGIN